MAGLEVNIITVQDIFQDEAGKKSRFSEEYKTRSARIILDKQNMAEIGAKDGGKLLVKNDVGSVVVVAGTSEDSHPGLAIMNSSPWSNQLVSGSSCQGGVPGFKGIKAMVQPAEGNASVTELSEIFSRIKG